ncbi:hypothetical protein GDO81_008239 [Engystomops pustulosus]|uniref:Uncharacterized protein n=1 Tax=Engystomops pustulosus TaxID=76066 RepID=A0AAV7CE63_ENGPU|nr:hypothetical protein GDO81_008239 [Engystomops pustulosus]
MSLSHPRNKARRGSYDGILHNKTQHKSLAQRRCSAPSLVLPKALSKPWSSGRYKRYPVLCINIHTLKCDLERNQHVLLSEAYCKC